jgi:hypothetical protein
LQNASSKQGGPIEREQAKLMKRLARDQAAK